MFRLFVATQRGFSKKTSFGFGLIPVLLLAGCSSTPAKKEAKVFSAGEKATVGNLVYSVVDTQFAPVLGDDPASQRTPKDRFVVVQISVSNSGSAEANIPALTLVDDSGQTYPELGDGTGVQRWLGVIRKVGATQTESGEVLFDAPAKHYRLRLTDELDDEVSIDIPLSYIHEEMKDMKSTQDASPIIDIPKK
ncbi:MAG TPA: DUF4352 domain-containing protein [Bryobacteraceae bacterium]|jgi:hypothetical protein|nr:DUF4352 domain-containing protein [Bryobacteraceae bacterium]